MSFIYLFYSCFQLNEILVMVCTTIIYAGIIYVNSKQASKSTIKITNLDEWHYGFQDKTVRARKLFYTKRVK